MHHKTWKLTAGFINSFVSHSAIFIGQQYPVPNPFELYAKSQAKDRNNLLLSKKTFLKQLLTISCKCVNSDLHMQWPIRYHNSVKLRKRTSFPVLLNHRLGHYVEWDSYNMSYSERWDSTNIIRFWARQGLRYRHIFIWYIICTLHDKANVLFCD